MKANIKKLPICSPKKTNVTIAELTSLLNQAIPKDFAWYLNFEESQFGVLIYDCQFQGDWQFEIHARSLRGLLTKISQENWAEHRRRSWSEMSRDLTA